MRDYIHHLSDLLVGDVPLVWERDWREVLVACYITMLTGPLLVLAWWIQRWNARIPWDSEDHRAGTKRFAVTFIVCDLCLLFTFHHFQTELFSLWFPTTWSWFLFRFIVWYVHWMLLAPALALLLERLDPRTKPLERALLPTEQQSAAQQATRKQVIVSTLDRAATAPKKRKKGRPVPLGQLLLQDREAQRQQARQIYFHQPPLLSNETDTPGAPPSSPAPKSPRPSSEAKPANTVERRQPESLDHLF